MKQQLENLIRTVDEMHLIERLMQAKTTDERIDICADAATTPQFQTFMCKYKEALEALEELRECDSIFKEDEFEATPENALQIAIICIVEDIDDIDLFEDYEQFADALRGVDGSLEEVAQKIVQIIGTVADEKGACFSDYGLKELLEEIF